MSNLVVNNIGQNRFYQGSTINDILFQQTEPKSDMKPIFKLRLNDDQLSKITKIVDRNGDNKIEGNKEQNLFTAFFDTDGDNTISQEESNSGKRFLDVTDISKWSGGRDFVLDVKKGWDEIPQKDRNLFIQERKEITLADDMKSYDPEIAEMKALGYKTQNKMKNSIGLYLKGKKVLILTETYIPINDPKPHKASKAQIQKVLFHEFGHVINLLKDSNIQAQIKKAYERDLFTMSDENKGKLKYYIQGSSFNPNDKFKLSYPGINEALAESYAAINYPGYNDDLFRKNFSNTISELKTFLGGSNNTNQNSPGPLPLGKITETR